LHVMKILAHTLIVAERMSDKKPQELLGELFSTFCASFYLIEPRKI